MYLEVPGTFSACLQSQGLSSTTTVRGAGIQIFADAEQPTAERLERAGTPSLRPGLLRHPHAHPRLLSIRNRSKQRSRFLFLPKPLTCGTETNSEQMTTLPFPLTKQDDKSSQPFLLRYPYLVVCASGRLPYFGAPVDPAGGPEDGVVVDTRQVPRRERLDLVHYRAVVGGDPNAPDVLRPQLAALVPFQVRHRGAKVLLEPSKARMGPNTQAQGDARRRGGAEV